MVRDGEMGRWLVSAVAIDSMLHWGSFQDWFVKLTES